MNAAARRYATMQTQTASRERLMIMMFETALRHIRAAHTALEADDRPAARVPLQKSQDIVTELMATLDSHAAPQLCSMLQDVYSFTAGRLLRASITGSAQDAADAERVFSPVADAFQKAVAALAQP